MSFKITDEAGFVSEDGFIDLPKVTITVKDTSLGLYVKAGSILWKRNSEFSTAEVEVDDKRIDSTNMLGDGLTVGAEIVISAGGEVLFSGYIMSQSMRASQGTDQIKDESIVYKCVDYKYDLYREVIIGQVGKQASPDTGEEMKTGGLYGSGEGWFTGLDCVFNDRTFAKNAESTWSHGPAIGRHGNGRKEKEPSPSAAFSVIFDGDYFAFNTVAVEEVPDATRNISWSAWDMINYVMSYCYKPPYTLASVIGTGDIDDFFAEPELIIVETKRIILDIANGMDAAFPEGVDVQGLRATDALTKICGSCGYHWTLEPTAGASVLKVWRTGTSLSSKKLFLAGGEGTGYPTGLYNTGIAKNAFPLVNKVKWNIDDLDINIDYTTVIGCLIGTTQNIRIQDIFGLKKGWTNDIFFDLVKKALISATKTSTGALDLEEPVYHEADSADTKKTIRYTIQLLTNNMVQLNIQNSDEQEGLKSGKQDSIFSIFRRWITDETGMLLDPAGAKRRPHNFTVNGLIVTHGSTYMVKPRPFLNNNLATARSGDATNPRTFFPKVTHGQKAEIIPADKIDGKVDVRDELNRSISPKVKGGKEFHPYGAKKVSVKVLDNSSGIFIEGPLQLANMTIDPTGKTIHTLSPIVLGAVEHDQAGLIIDRSLAVIGKAGKMIAGRRWIDGKQYKIDRVQALETTGYSSPSQIEAGATAKIATAESHLAAYSIDETSKLAADLTAMKDYYNAPIISMRVRIPTITTAYKIGTSITGIESRIDFTSPGVCCIVGVNFDLRQMNTTISVESEVMDPKFGAA